LLNPAFSVTSGTDEGETRHPFALAKHHFSLAESLSSGSLLHYILVLDEWIA
jgi:hypothetical protein